MSAGDSGAAGSGSDSTAGATEAPRQRFELDDRGFNEVPKKYRKYYRRWTGPDDELGPNEVLCPVCKVVVRSNRELRPGDRMYCMACMTRMRIARDAEGGNIADCEY